MNLTEDSLKELTTKDVIEDKEDINKDEPKQEKEVVGVKDKLKVLVMVESEPSISAPKKGKPKRGK